MSVLDRFEKSVEGAVNGVFAKFGSKDLKPVDLSSALEREIDKEAMPVTRDRTVAPNEYRFKLSTPDFNNIVEWGAETLANELADNLTQYAKSQNYAFVGPVVVIFEEDLELSKGDYRLSSESVQGNTVPVTTDAQTEDCPMLEIGEHQYLLTEEKTINSMVPLWQRQKSKVKPEEYNSFYKEKFGDWQDPLTVIHTSAEGAVTYKALLYIPAKAPYDFYTKDFKKGLQLYSSGVLIMEKCADLLPDYFGFVKGLVDSQDLSLNISREMLQHDRQLKLIATRIEKKIASELKSMLEHDRENYEKFFESFGLRLKFGMYENYGINKDKLKDLVLFRSSTGKMRTLKEYVQDMKEDQTCIYYAAGETPERIAHLPQTEAVLDRGYEVLYLTDDVDEFALMVLQEYEGKSFKNVAAEDARVQTEEEKQAAEKQAEENKALLEKMKTILGERVKDVRVSTTLKNHPVCITTDGAISMEMEKVLNSMPGAEQKVKAEQIFELNTEHPVFEVLRRFENDEDKLKKYTEVLYDQALLIEGRSIEDPVAYANNVAELLAQ